MCLEEVKCPNSRSHEMFQRGAIFTSLPLSLHPPQLLPPLIFIPGRRTILPRGIRLEIQ